MPRVAFKQADVARAVKAVKAAGVDVARVEIDTGTGKIAIFATSGEVATPKSDLDRWLAKKDHAGAT